MTAQPQTVVLSAPAGRPSHAPTRTFALALRLFVHGLAVLATSVVLGVAQALELWMGALVVALALIVLAAVAALVGLVGRLRPHLTSWS